MAMVYDLPFFKTGNNWVMKNIVGNWESWRQSLPMKQAPW